MKLSESLRRQILETGTGGVTNKFKIKRRRNTFFFEEIGAEFVRLAERSGFSAETDEIGYRWMRMYFDSMIPDLLKKMPVVVLLNSIIKSVWSNIGLIDDMNVTREGNIIRIHTSGEALTRYAGETRLMRGFYRGVLDSLLKKSTAFESSSKDGSDTRYAFRITGGRPGRVESKDKEAYNRLNHMGTESAHNIRDLLKSKVFTIDENRIFFRGMSIVNTENTLLHLLGSISEMHPSISSISTGHFREIIDRESGISRNIFLMKNLLQSMGWGKISIAKSSNDISLIISNPPYGLQPEDDNWDFLANTFLGFLRVFDHGYCITDSKASHKKASFVFS